MFEFREMLNFNQCLTNLFVLSVFGGFYCCWNDRWKLLVAMRRLMTIKYCKSNSKVLLSSCICDTFMCNANRSVEVTTHFILLSMIMIFESRRLISNLSVAKDNNSQRLLLFCDLQLQKLHIVSLSVWCKFDRHHIIIFLTFQSYSVRVNS